MNIHYYIACDLGAESGRVILGTLNEDKLQIEEIHRFPNEGMDVSSSLRWNVVKIFEEIRIGLNKIVALGIEIDGISCDSWGVDYVLIGDNGPFIAEPYHYRDKRTDGALQQAFETMNQKEIFEETGIQFMSINTLYQMVEDAKQHSSIQSETKRFLNMGDYFNFRLSGIPKAEESLTSTTQLFNPRLKTWSQKIIKRFGLPANIFPDIVRSGTILGTLLPDISPGKTFSTTRVIAGCSHDTAAAVAAVPAQSNDWAYLSSGTWSLLGVESPDPIITSKSLGYSFTNEVGYGGTIRFLKNITGLWVVQECRRFWQRQGQNYSYDLLTELAEQSAPAESFIDLMDERFQRPGDMPDRIVEYCRETRQQIPVTHGDIIRCILSSLGILYKQTLDQIEELTGRRISILHIVGGGCKNTLLNKLSADITGRTVLAGPVECSAIGNILVQAITLGHISTLEAGREIVRKSFPVIRYAPVQIPSLQKTIKRFESVLH